MNCVDCKYSGPNGYISYNGQWNPTEGLACRLNPPEAQDDGNHRPGMKWWIIPAVPPDYLCGQYQPKPGNHDPVIR